MLLMKKIRNLINSPVLRKYVKYWERINLQRKAPLLLGAFLGLNRNGYTRDDVFFKF